MHASSLSYPNYAEGTTVTSPHTITSNVVNMIKSNPQLEQSKLFTITSGRHCVKHYATSTSISA